MNNQKDCMLRNDFSHLPVVYVVVIVVVVVVVVVVVLSVVVNLFVFCFELMYVKKTDDVREDADLSVACNESLRPLLP